LFILDSLIVNNDWLHAGPGVMEFSEQNNTQLVSPPTDLTVRMFAGVVLCIASLFIVILRGAVWMHS